MEEHYEEPVRNMDEDLTPDQVHEARVRTQKKVRLNTVYKILKNIYGRDNAMHAKEIIQKARDDYGVDDVTTNDITECVNRLVKENHLPDLMSERKRGYYRPATITEEKIGLYEIAMIIKGYWNRWHTFRDVFVKRHGYGLIPDDPLDYKDEVGDELNHTDDL